MHSDILITTTPAVMTLSQLHGTLITQEQQKR